MSLIPRSCSTCAAAFSDGPQRFCRFNPPQVTIAVVPVQNALGQQGLAPQSFSAWPPVEKDQWCMQWSRDLTLQLS